MATLLVTAVIAPPAAAQTGGPISDPVPTEPATSSFGLVLEEFAQLPKSEPTPAPEDPRLMRHARINYLGEVPDGSGRLYVPDLNGKLYLLSPVGVPQEYLDVGATFAPDFFSGRGLGQGFGFVTFHPEFAQNGLFYTVHTEFGPGLATKPPDLTPQPGTTYHGIITEWKAADPRAATFSGTRREVLRLGFAGRIHGIQQVDFNPTARKGAPDYGLLYIAAGDGGTGVGNDEPQNLGIPQGKILRIDPAGRDAANGEYGIPRDNPFVGRPGAIGEIYAYGMRDPHRFTWDPKGRNRLFMGHIGEHAIEAIYDVQAGDNFGWSVREGRYVFNRAERCNLYPLPADDAGFTYPVAEYDHDPPPNHPCNADSGNAVSGGFVYRGNAVPQLRGKYVFGDLVNGRVFYTEEGEMRRDAPPAVLHEMPTLFNAAGEPVTMADLAGDRRIDMRFGTNAAGELFVLAKANGKIWKVTGTREFAGCDVGRSTVAGAVSPTDWAPVTPSKWQFQAGQVVLAEAGAQRPGPRRPFEYAVLSKGPVFGSVQIDGQVRLDTPVEVSNRDVIIMFGHRSDTEFYYAHLSSDNKIYPHNGIFKVNNADRERIDHQWNANRSQGAPPAITDAAWHRVRVTHCAGTGEIAVYLDGAKAPLLTAVDKTFDSGRVGFGSFDNIGRLRGLVVHGTPNS